MCGSRGKVMQVCVLLVKRKDGADVLAKSNGGTVVCC